MQVYTAPSGPLFTNSYLVVCEKTKEAVVIDPAPGSFHPISRKIQKHHLKLCGLWLTHSHWDHLGDMVYFKRAYPVPLSVHPADQENVKRPGADGLPCPFCIEGVQPDSLLVEGEILEVGALRFLVIHTPGHTPGGVCYYEAAEKGLFTGDTLFKGSIGNLSFSMSEPEKMWHSLEKLSGLPKETRVYAGHGESTTLEEESWLDRAKEIFGNSSG